MWARLVAPAVQALQGDRTVPAAPPPAGWREKARGTCDGSVLGEERAQNVLHDAAVAVVVGLAGGVDADDRVELHRTGANLDGPRDAAVVEGLDADEVEGLLAGQAERGGVGALGVLRAQHAH